MMVEKQLEPEAWHALALGWTITELLGRYNRYLHPDNPEAKRKLRMGYLPAPTYTRQKYMGSNTDQAYACALRLGALIDALGFEESERSFMLELHQEVKALAVAIRTYQRTGDHQSALEKSRFWPLLEDWSLAIRPKLHSMGEDLAVCFSFAGTLAKLYWLLPVADEDGAINWKRELQGLYFKIGDARSLLDSLKEFLPASLRIPLRHTLSRWRSFTQKWKRARVSIEEAELTLIVDTLAKQSENWASVILNEKIPEEYLTLADWALAHFLSLLLPGAILLPLALILALGLPSLWQVFVEIALPHLEEVPVSGWFKAQLSASDLLAIASAIGAAVASASATAIWLLRRLEQLRKWLLNWARDSLAGRRILILPSTDPFLARVDKWLREPVGGPRTYPRK